MRVECCWMIVDMMMLRREKVMIFFNEDEEVQLGKENFRGEDDTMGESHAI